LLSVCLSVTMSVTGHTTRMNTTVTASECQLCCGSS